MAEKRKILHIVEAMGGGVFTYLVELANGLCNEFEVTIAFGIRSETPENYADYFDDTIKLIKVENFERSLNPVKDIKACLELRKIVKSSSPDIIHMHSSKAGAIGRITINSKKHRMFYTPHGYSFLMEDVSNFKKNIYKKIEEICGKKNCMTIACGKSEWEESKKVTKKSTYISNGINTERLDQVLTLDQGVYPKNKFTVYTVGRISYQKNPELFNKTAQLVPDVQFIWIGDGDMKECLTSPNIKVTGWTESEDALRLAKQGDVFILPSRWEGLPISLLEAMYMKKPCIVSNVVGNKDVISDYVTGYICNTAEEFAEVIRKLEKEIDIRVTEGAHKEVMEKYNSNGLCDRYREVYLGK
ncbi:MAG: glycosyltransferase [Eubacterium sp.]